MGLSTKQVSGDLDWGQTFLQSAAAETTSKPPPPTRRQQPQQQQPEPLKCPRCASTNTKFCYYNNYNKSQPRHFCKSCKRHWTKGGTLRNVPVGGGRKNKRPKPNKSAPANTAAIRRQDLPTGGGSGGKKNMPNILYHALIGRSPSPLLHDTSKALDNCSISTSLSAAAAAPQLLPSTEFHFSSLNSFDMNASLNPSSYQPLNAFDHFAGNLDTAEESTITTVNIPGCGGGPWGGPDSSSALDLPSYWNWNEIDVLTSGDLSISWEEEDNKAVMKP